MEFVSETDFKVLKSKVESERYILTDLRGKSMLPLLKDGQEIRVQNSSSDQLKIFDTIVFWDGTKLICHIIKHVNSVTKSYVTTGLLLKQEDTPVNHNQILGTVALSVPLHFRIYLMLRWKFKD